MSRRDGDRLIGSKFHQLDRFQRKYDVINRSFFDASIGPYRALAHCDRGAGDRYRWVRESRKFSLLRHPGLAHAGEQVLSVRDHDRNIRAGQSLEVGSILSDCRQLAAGLRRVAPVEFARFSAMPEIGKRGRLRRLLDASQDPAHLRHCR